jgi:hypothetical protein
MFNCKDCGFYSNNKNRYEAHRKTTKHFLKTGEIVQENYQYCEPCNFKAFYDSKWKEHLKTKKHKERTSIPDKIFCKQCDYWSYYKSNFNQHMYRHRNKGDLNLKKTKIKQVKESLDNVKKNKFVEDREILKSKISDIVLYLYKNKIDPNKHFNYNYYCNKNVELSIVELNDFYDELKSIL